MSAIAGITSTMTDDLRAIGAMIDQMPHRGPDGDGWMWLGETGEVRAEHGALPPTRPVPAIAAMAHRRLGDGPEMPLADAEQRYWIALDGTLDALDTLREQLRERGIGEIGDNDAHTILIAFRELGPACFAELHGAFALAILDTKERKLTLARDRLGIKPLYAWTYRGHLVFASEIKALFVLPEIRPKLERNTMGDFILGNALPPGKRFFANVHEFPPGHHATVEIAQPVLKPEPYWRAPSGRLLISEAEATEQFRSLFLAAVERQRGDGSGICLDGTRDGTAVACALRRTTDEDTLLYSFSAVFEDPARDTRHWINAANAGAHTITNWVAPTPEDFLIELDHLLWYQDEPFADPAVYAHWCVLRAAREAKTHRVLDGFGADLWLARPRRKQGWLRKQSAEEQALKRLVRNAPPPATPAPAALGETLRSIDRNAMAFSVEQRMPLLDDALAQFSLSLPDDLRTPAFLQRAFGDLIPETIATRPEAAPIPGADWVYHAILPLLLRDIKMSRMMLVPIIDGGQLREMVTQQLERPDVALAPLLFRLFIANRWMLRFHVTPVT